MFVHPRNINLNGGQEALMDVVAPLFGVRQAIIERNSLPSADDGRVRQMREAYQFTGGLYFYFNGITPQKVVDKKFVVVPPEPRWFERARLVVENGAVPLFGPAPHNLCRTEGSNQVVDRLALTVHGPRYAFLHYLANQHPCPATGRCV
jgi:hypothetical protein